MTDMIDMMITIHMIDITMITTMNMKEVDQLEEGN